MVRQQATTVVLQLTGAARTLADEMDMQSLMHGAVIDMEDGRDARQGSGIMLLLYRLGQRFGKLEVETTVRAIIDFMTFRRVHQEPVDVSLARFDVLQQKAREHAAVEMSPAVLAY